MITRAFAAAILFGLGHLPAAAQDAEPHIHLLFRNSLIDGAALHIATFDADDGNIYNRENCNIAASLFASQPGVSVRYWCEPSEVEQR